MQPLQAEQIHGNWATLLLVWNEHGYLDLDRVGSEIDVLIAMGVDGIYAFGSAGEFHAITDEEFLKVAEWLAIRCDAANMPFQIGVSHMSAIIAVNRLARIRDLAPGAVQVTLPDWLAPSDEEVEAFLERMITVAGDIGLVLYNPPHAKRVLDWETLGRLAERFPRLVGVKVADGDEDWYAAMRQHKGRLSVFIPGHHLATGMQQGAHGAYSNVACLHPGAAQRWTDQARAGESDALELEGRLRAFFTEHILPFIQEHHYCGAACDRLLALIGGWGDVGEQMRWPYRSIPASEAERIRPMAQRLLPEFF